MWDNGGLLENHPLCARLEQADNNRLFGLVPLRPSRIAADQGSLSQLACHS
jgi:hypothetical protein